MSLASGKVYVHSHSQGAVGDVPPPPPPGHPNVLELLISNGASTCVPASNGGLLYCANYEGIQHQLEYHRKAQMTK